MFDLGGTYRAVSAEQTLAQIQPMLWDKFGISRIGNITGLDHVGIPTYIAIRPRSKILTNAQGKGITHDLAKVSAMMESIEGWHAETMPDPDLFGAWKNLKRRYRMIDLEPHLNHGPVAWGDMASLEIPWAKGIELNSGEAVYFPYSLIHMDTTCFSPGYRFFPCSTNGLASGNTYEEAVCHALFELIERECDATDHGHHRDQVDVSTIHSPHIKMLLTMIEQAKLHLTIWDISTRLSVPAFYVELHDKHDLRTVGIQRGAGAHFSSVVALSRAITEAVQARATIIAGSRDDKYPPLYALYKTYGLLRSDQNDDADVSRRHFIETIPPLTFTTCLNQQLAVLKQAGYDNVIVYEHTRRELGIPVVHALIPGLRYIGGSCYISV